MKGTTKQTLIAAALVCALGATTAYAQAQSSFYRPLTLAPADEPAGGGGGAPAKESEDQGGLSEEELAKIAQNPVANLISVPFQNNFDFGAGLFQSFLDLLGFFQRLAYLFCILDMAGCSMTNFDDMLSDRFQAELGIESGNPKHIAERDPAFIAELFKNRPWYETIYILCSLEKGDQVAFFSLVFPD